MNARLIEARDIADEVRHFVFEAETEDFPYAAGQFVSFSGVVDGKAVTRAYSIASSPPGPRFELCLNRVKEGRLSPRLFALQPGDRIELRGPFGYFVMRHPSHESVMVATGTGIAPLRAMIGTRFARLAPDQPVPAAHTSATAGGTGAAGAPPGTSAAEPPGPLTLIFGVRYQHNLMYREEFERLAREHPGFRFWPTLSRPDDGWQGRRGHVQEHLLEAVGARRDIDIYICGLKEMVDDVRGRLKELGFDRKHIIYEKYD